MSEACSDVKLKIPPLIAVIFQLKENVDEDKRGIISGVQNGVSSFGSGGESN